MGTFIQVVTTTDSREAAERIARSLVHQHLAACVQIDGPLTSIYHWQGQVEEAEEWRLTVKSRTDLFEEVVSAIRGLHAYDVPEIVATQIDLLDMAYRQWLEEETSSAGRDL